MKSLRPVVLGIIAALLAVMASLVVASTQVKAFVFDTSAAPPRPGVALTREEVEARTRQAEAQFEAVRSVETRDTFAVGLVADASNAFTYFGPLFAVAAVLLLRPPELRGVLLASLPTAALLLVLGPNLPGILLLGASAVIAVVVTRFRGSVGRSRGDDLPPFIR